MSHPCRVSRVLPVIALLALVPAPTGAVTLSWNNASGGPASTAGNWSPPGVPTAGDPLVFNLPGTYAVSFDNLASTSASHSYRAGHVAFTMSTPHTLSGSVTAGTLPGDAPTMSLSGTLSAPLSSAIGSFAGTNATFLVSGAGSQFLVTNPGADLRVGYSGTGVLAVDGGGLVQVNDDLRIGEQSGANGTVTVDGASGMGPTTVRTLGAAGDILVGISGTGALVVTAGAAVVAQGALRVNAASLVEVRDLASITVGGPLVVEGRLNLEGGTMSADELQLSAPSVLSLRIGGSDAGEFDRIAVTGAATLGGTLRLPFPPGAALTQGVAIPLVTASSISNTFADVIIEGYPHPAALAVSHTPTQVLLTLEAAVDVPAPPVLPSVLAFVGARAAGTPAFRLDLPRAADVRVELFDPAGRRVGVLADRAFAEGSHRIELSPPGGGAPRQRRGVYFGRATVRVAGRNGPGRRLSDRIVLD